MTGNVLTQAIEEGVPLIVLAPHLDDAALSCGALMLHAARRTSVTAVTFFTEAGPPPYTLSARHYLRLTGARDGEALYRQRRAEDRAALEHLGVTCVHVGLTDALFRRRRPCPRWRSRSARLLPELAHLYPVYRMHITSGRVATADAGTLGDMCAVIRRLADSGPGLVLAPAGVGGHVDHVLVGSAAFRSAAQRSAAQVVYYSDFPYNQRIPLDNISPANGQVRTRWFEGIEGTEGKTELIRAYRTQVDALFPNGTIPLVPEVFSFTPETLAGSALAATETS